jgi:hypothetical protein
MMPDQPSVPVLKAHPLANLFPLFERAELDLMADDIGERGMQEQIVLDEDDLILDGRNRYRAWLWCTRADKPPLRTRRFGSLPSDGTDKLAFIISANLIRRQLNESQRAMVAARLAVLPRGANQHSQICIPSQEVAAQQCNVSQRLVADARLVLVKGTPELITAVDQGEIRVSAAANIVHQSRDSQIARIERDRAKANGEHRHPEGWYRTPADVVVMFLAKERFGPTVWEPCCGDGALSRVLEAHGYTVISQDLHDRDYGESGRDFLEAAVLEAEDLVTNPSYDEDFPEKFVLHALKLGARKVAVLCRLNWVAGANRYRNLFTLRQLARVWVCAARPALWRGDRPAESDGGMTDYAWFVFERDHDGPYVGDWLIKD